MNTKDALRSTARVSGMVLDTYYSDLSDEELMRRPGEGCNHVAWQLGHLIASECGLLESVCPGKAAELPEGFAEQHDKEHTTSDDPADFRTKEEYLALAQQVRAASMAALDEIDDAQLDEPSPEHFREMFPTVGDIFVLIATHSMMHAGQIVPIRRALGKPIMM